MLSLVLVNVYVCMQRKAGGELETIPSQRKILIKLGLRNVECDLCSVLIMLKIMTRLAKTNGEVSHSWTRHMAPMNLIHPKETAWVLLFTFLKSLQTRGTISALYRWLWSGSCAQHQWPFRAEQSSDTQRPGLWEARAVSAYQEFVFYTRTDFYCVQLLNIKWWSLGCKRGPFSNVKT